MSADSEDEKPRISSRVLLFRQLKSGRKFDDRQIDDYVRELYDQLRGPGSESWDNLSNDARQVWHKYATNLGSG